MDLKNVRVGSLSAASCLALMAGAASAQFAGFGAPEQYPGGGVLIWSPAAGDFNGDGADDIVASLGIEDLTVLMSNGDGTFAAPQVQETGGGRSQTDPVVGLVDADANLDVVLPTGDGPAILLGNGDGTFQPAVVLAYDDNGGADVADLDGDGATDLVITADVGGTSESEIVVLQGHGDGTFTQVGFIEDEIGGPNYVRIGDFNNDEIPDLVVALPGSREASVYLGNGDLTFGEPLLFPTSSNATLIKLGDFNGDGNLDFANVQGNPEQVNVDVFLGDGTGDFPIQNVYVGDVHSGLLVVEDLDGDGLDDIVTSGTGQDGFVVSLSDGDGTFTDAGFFEAGNDSVRATFGDFDGNGTPDIALANLSVGAVTVRLNLAPGTVACAADRDGDGDKDVQDLLAYLRSFRAREADMDGDNDTDVQDLLGYLRAFRAGCD